MYTPKNKEVEFFFNSWVFLNREYSGVYSAGLVHDKWHLVFKNGIEITTIVHKNISAEDVKKDLERLVNLKIGAACQYFERIKDSKNIEDFTKKINTIPSSKTLNLMIDIINNI
ncbi:MAG: hypothetical protein ACOC1K_07250 [Nanoarchaeota archaeon]